MKLSQGLACLEFQIMSSYINTECTNPDLSIIKDAIDGVTVSNCGFNFKMPHTQTLSSNMRYGQTILFGCRDMPILLQNNNNRKIKANSKMSSIANRKKFKQNMLSYSQLGLNIKKCEVKDRKLLPNICFILPL